MSKFISCCSLLMHKVQLFFYCLLHPIVRGLVVKTDGYSAEGSEFDSHSGCYKYQYIGRVVFTLSHTSLVPRPEFKLEFVLWGARLVKVIRCFDLEINFLISLWFVCFHRVDRWFSPSTSAFSTITTDFPVS